MTEGKLNLTSEQASEIAGDSLSLFRINLILIGLYSSIMALFYREASELVLQVLNSGYTVFGLGTWVGAMIAGLFHYRYARRFAISAARHERLAPPDNASDVLVNAISAIAVGTLLAVVSLIIGAIDGVSAETPAINEVLFAVFAAVFPITLVFILFYYWDKSKILFPWLRWDCGEWADWWNGKK